MSMFLNNKIPKFSPKTKFSFLSPKNPKKFFKSVSTPNIIQKSRLQIKPVR